MGREERTPVMANTRLAVRWTIAIALLSQFTSFARARHLVESPPTFRDWLDGNDAILIVQLKPDPNDPTKYQREADIVKIIRSRDPLLEAGKSLPVPVPFRGEAPLPLRAMIVFGQTFKGKLDWYSGINADAEAIGCVNGLLNLDPKDKQKVLHFSFDFLNSPNADIAGRAYAEWDKAKPADADRVAKKLPAKQVRALIQDARAPRHVRDLACFLLGHCGEEKDAALVRQHLDVQEPVRERRGTVDDALKGYVLLKPKEAWQVVAAR